MQSVKKIEEGSQLRRYIFDITPQTAVRTTQGDRIFFKIPRDKLRPEGLKRLKRIERYNQYKEDISGLAKSIRFLPVEQGMHITFYFPVSKTWPKYKKKAMHMKLHSLAPDIDNIYKVWADALLPDDRHISDVRITKKWVNQEKGWIEVIIYNPNFPSGDTLL